MSVRNKQIEHVLADIVRVLYSTGVKPPLNDILEMASEYFSLYPAGSPLPLPLDYIRGDTRSDVDAMNEIMSALDVNIDLMYEVSQEQVDEIMGLATQLRSHMQRLRALRGRIETQIDDYLLSLYNSDGYYYSISDAFSDLALVDLSMTSAYVNTDEGVVQLPTISSLSKRIEGSRIQPPTINVSTGLGGTPAYRTIAPWSGAVDGLTNTVWAMEVETSAPTEVIVTLQIPFADPGAEISKIDVDPYGITEAQYFVDMETADADGAPQRMNFGDKILTTMSKFSLVDTPHAFRSCIITMRKTLHDYVDNNSGSLRYKYVFGLKDLAFTEQTYDNEARVVSKPLSVPGELEDQYVIDAISLTATYDTPPDTAIEFYVAEDTGGIDVGDFSWKRIQTVDSNAVGSKTIRFNGARTISKDVVSNPQPNQLQRIPVNTSDRDLTKRNPSPTIVPGADIWRLCKFDDESALLNSIRLQEGVNTVRWYDTTYHPDAVASLEWWASRIPDLVANYSRIDVGNEFFYGGDVGEANRSVYMETYVEIDSDIDPVHAEFRKTDVNAKTWAVRIYLNGRDIGYLPVGVDKALIPYTFQQGRNHIAVVALIPPATNAVPNPYIGTLDLMSTSDLFDHGAVSLASWNYVDPFDMKYNQDNTPFTFTIINDEIVSRRQPTTNFRVVYSSKTGQGPAALRFRADLSRGVDNKNMTPTLSQYRLRFSYSE